MNRTRSLIVPEKRSLLPLLIGLLIGSAALAYGVARWQRPAPVESAQAQSAESAGAAATQSPQAPEPEATPASPEGAAAPSAGEATPVSGDKGDKGAPPPAATATIKMEPLIANLDEGDQLRYLKLGIQLEVDAAAQQRIQGLLPRARHEALMYMSGLHLADVQGMLGKQRVHRELQRRIADAVGGGLKRIYFDEFVVQ